jgi:hypothetical protein
MILDLIEKLLLSILLLLLTMATVLSAGLLVIACKLSWRMMFN